MLKNHLVVALRTIARQPGQAAINVLGLAVGVACCLLILHFVQDEVAFDRFHENGDRIYRLVSEGDYYTVGWPYGRILEEEFPEVEEVVYMRSWPAWAVLHEGERHYERVRYADERFFQVFDFPLLEGDRSAALADPYSMVITDTFARKLFGGDSALGRTLTIGDTIAVTVTGVAQVPRQSHIQFDALLSFATLGSLFPQMVERSFASGWLDLNVINYVLLREGADAEALATRIRDLPQERAPDVMAAFGSDLHLGLEPLRSIYLRSDVGTGLGPAGDVTYVYLLSLAGLLILLLAAVNFVNLATSQAASRAREVGVRKSVGASRASLVRQFLVESTLTSLAAVVAGAALAWLALPFFSELADRAYHRADLLAPAQLLALLALVGLIGLCAGLYPAFAVSRFNPVQALRGRFGSGREGARLRKGLVVFQFGITSLLLIGTLTVLHQLRYMESRPLGFSGDQVVVVDGRRAPDLAPGARPSRRPSLRTPAFSAWR
jgi:putative ABC transport system permease protein